jgi:hypothetical protein
MPPQYIEPLLDNPYPPETDYEISEFKYESAMILRREIEAVQTRGDSEDAEYILGAEYTISYRLNGGDARKITVPRGMVTDLSSVPRLTRFFIDRVGPHLEASIVHDFLYLAWQDVPELKNGPPRKDHQRFADELLNAGLKEAELGSFKRFIIYQAVRNFGWSSFSERNPQRYIRIP